MSNVDDTVVSITFDNAQFEAAIQQTLISLETLRASLNFETAVNPLASLDTSTANYNLNEMGAAVDNISSKFSTMGAVAFTAIQEVTRGAIDFVQSTASRIIDPILSGGAARSLAIEQARFQFAGLGQDVEASMESALDAVRGTAYGLDEAATLAGIFGASGVEAGEQLTRALRGVAGAAGITGTGFAEMGQIFQNVAALGHVTNNDLNSLALRGLGIGTIAEKFHVTQEELRAMATEGSISFQQFSDVMFEAFGEHAVRANETYTGSLKNLRSAMSRLGEDFQTPKFAALRPVFNALGPAIDSVAAALEPFIFQYTKFLEINSAGTVRFLEGLDFTTFERIINRSAPGIFKALGNIKEALLRFIEPIRDAFRRILPEKPAEQFQQIVHSIVLFTDKLKISKETADKFRRVFSGLIAIGQIIFAVFKGIVGVIAGFIGGFSDAGSGLLDFSSGLGDSLVRLKEFLVDGGRIQNFFDGLSHGLESVMTFLRESPVVQFFVDAVQALFGAIGDLVDGLTELDDGLGRVKDRFTESDSIFQKFGRALLAGLNAIQDAASAIFDYLANAFDGLGEAIANSLSEGDFSEVLDVLNVGVLGALTVLLQRFFDGGLQLNFGSLTAANATLTRLSTTLAAMSIEIKARALLKIAEALALLTASVLVLSLIDSAALTRALGAIAVGLGELVGTLVLLTKGLGPVGAAKLVGVAVAMGLISVAILFMSFAVKNLSGLGWEELAKGLIGTAVLLAALSLAVAPLSASSGSMIATGLGLIAVAIALNIMALAVKSMADLSWEDMARGLIGVAGALIIITGAVRLLPTGMVRTGVGLLAIGIGLVAISAAVKAMSTLDWGEMARGLTGLGIALLGLAGAANIMSGTILGAIAIGIIAGSLLLLAAAVKAFSSFEWDDLIKGLVGMSVALGVIVALGYAASGALVGLFGLAVSLVPIAAGVLLLAVAMQKLGEMDIGDLLMSVGALLAVIGIIALLAIGATALAETLPFLAALGAALLLIGGAFALVGVGAYLIARAFEILGNATVDATDNVIAAIEAIATTLPVIAGELAEGVIAFLQIIFDAAPELIEGIITILGDLLDGIITLAPKFKDAFVEVFTQGLEAFVEISPQFITAGFSLILDLLEAIRDNIGPFCDVAREIVMKLASCAVENGSMLAGAAFRLIGSFLGGIRDRIADVFTTGTSVIRNFISGIAGRIGSIASSGLQSVTSFVSGITGAIGRVLGAGATMVRNIVTGIGNALGSLIASGVRIVSNIVTGIGAAAGSLLSAGFNIAGDLISGLVSGILGGLSSVVDAVVNVAQAALNAAKDFFGISSPSKVFMDIGNNLVEGFAIGLTNNSSGITGINRFGNDVLTKFKKIVDTVSSTLNNLDDMNPTIIPVLDLSNVEKDAKKLGHILGPNSITAGGSHKRALDISLETKAAAAAQADAIDQHSGIKEIKFEQTINSPTALSTGKVYRNTKSQISMAKKELGVML